MPIFRVLTPKLTQTKEERFKNDLKAFKARQSAPPPFVTMRARLPRDRVCLGCMTLPNLATVGLADILPGLSGKGPPGVAFWLPDMNAATDLCHFFFVRPENDFGPGLYHDAKVTPIGTVEMTGLLHCVLMIVHNNPIEFEAAIKERYPGVVDAVAESMNYEWWNDGTAVEERTV